MDTPNGPPVYRRQAVLMQSFPPGYKLKKSGKGLLLVQPGCPVRRVVLIFAGMDIVTLTPQSQLRPFVRAFWYASVPAQNRVQRSYQVMADGAPGIIFQHAQSRSALCQADGTPLPVSFVYGQKSQGPCTNYASDSYFIFGVSLQPAAFKQLFALDAFLLTDSLLDTAHLFPQSFGDSLLNASGPQQVCQLFSRALIEKLPRAREDRMVDEGIRLLLQDASETNAASLPRHFAISRRQFQRRFRAGTGVCPEMYMRIARFQKALYNLRSGHYEKLSDIAYQLGYADQSHFNREFKHFSGCSPGAFRKANIPLSLSPQKSDTLRIVETR